MNLEVVLFLHIFIADTGGDISMGKESDIKRHKVDW
jgi:hypothetical protein